ncbi:MAG: hypothetical protein OXC00_12320 [Acidimicrobiaceae bacterium]|nr:hypothetical protein [Acidimicrobiaceae bacterium]
MSRRRRPPGPRGSQSASRPRQDPIPADPGLDEVDSRREDWTWLEISEEEREALLKETDIYLAELAEEVGEPSAEHIANAQALVDRLNGA